MQIHLINSRVFNANIIHKKKGGKLTPLQFRTKLVSQIIKKYGEDTDSYSCGGRTSAGDNPFQFVEQHFHSYIPATEKSNATKGCAVCKRVVSERNDDMKVSRVMQHSVLLLVLKFIIKLRYFKCYGYYLYTYNKKDLEIQSNNI